MIGGAWHVEPPQAGPGLWPTVGKRFSDWFGSKFVSKMAAFHMAGWTDSGAAIASSSIPLGIFPQDFLFYHRSLSA
jgi:hypothetical protein